MVGTPNGAQQIWMDNLNCQGPEVRVRDCAFNDDTEQQPVGWQWGTLSPENNCTHANDIGVGCDVYDDALVILEQPPINTTTGAYPNIRLVNGVSNSIEKTDSRKQFDL